MVHLIVLQHGLWGDPSHLDYLLTKLQSAASNTSADTSDIEILNSVENVGPRTYNGVDGCGARLLTRVLERLHRAERPVTRISFIGYSLGGLVLRYVIGALEARGWLQASSDLRDRDDRDGDGSASGGGRRRTRTVKAEVFATFATPHLGTRMPDVDSGVLQWYMNFMAMTLTGPTGPQVTMKDASSSTRRPPTANDILIEDDLLHSRPFMTLLSDPRLPFWQGLAKFRRRMVYANIDNDRLVPYLTASILLESPFDNSLPEAERYVSINPERYPSIVVPANAVRPPGGGSEDQQKILLALLKSPIFPVILVGMMIFAAAYNLSFQSQRAASNIHSLIFTSPRPPPTPDSEFESSLPPLSTYTSMSTFLRAWKRQNWTPPLHTFAGWSETDVGNGDVGGVEKFAVWALGCLEWERFSVWSKKIRSHATIVRRTEKFGGNEDVVEHFVDLVFGRQSLARGVSSSSLG